MIRQKAGRIGWGHGQLKPKKMRGTVDNDGEVFPDREGQTSAKIIRIGRLQGVGQSRGNHSTKERNVEMFAWVGDKTWQVNSEKHTDLRA